MADYSSQYASLVNSSNDHLGNLAAQNQAEFINSANAIVADTKDKQDRIDKLHQSEQLGLLPEALKDSDYTDSAVFGIKTTLDLGDNLKEVGKQKRLAATARRGALIAPAAKTENRTAVLLGDLGSDTPAKSLADIPAIATDDLPPVRRAFAAVKDSKIGQKIAQVGSDVAQGAKDIKLGASSFEGVGQALVKEASDPISLAGKALGKLAPVADLASGGLNIGADIDGLIKGKSLTEAMGDNSEERWSNALGIAGSALTFIPGADLVGGLLDVTSGILDFFGEKDEAETKDAAANAKIDKINKEATPSMATPISMPGMASLGIISNYSKPQQTLIQGSGVF